MMRGAIGEKDSLDARKNRPHAALPRPLGRHPWSRPATIRESPRPVPPGTVPDSVCALLTDYGRIAADGELYR
jgi:hypothetical protein